MIKYIITVLLIINPIIINSQIIRQYSTKIDNRAVQFIGSSDNNIENKNINVFISLRSSDDKERLTHLYNIHFVTSCGNDFTAIVPIQKIEELSKDEGVKQIAVCPVTINMMDEAKKAIHLNEINESSINFVSSYRGKGVLIGIIDSGFDYTHPNFKDKDGKCRIINVWEQGISPMYNTKDKIYGRILSNTKEILEKKTDNNYQTHGTHVAGIAAGSAFNNYRGIVPESDIVLVSTNSTEQGIVDGVAYLIDYAKKLNKPIAINISIGTMRGYKDGSGYMARMIDNLVYNKKGCLIAIAAGNEGNRTSTLIGTDNKSFLKMSKYGTDNIFIEGKKGSEGSVTFLLYDSSKKNSVFSHTFSMNNEWTRKIENFAKETDPNARIIASCKLNPLTNNPSIELNFSYRKKDSEDWILILKSKNKPLIAYSDYGFFTSNSMQGFKEGTSDYTIAMTATGKMPISVGAFVTRNTWKSLTDNITNKTWKIESLYPLSAKGPTSDGRIKPDILAPGAAIVSSYSSYANLKFAGVNPNADCIYKENYNGRIYYWGIESGTSMATPIVTGILALMLEINPNLTLSEAKQIITDTAIKEDQMGILPNNKYGAGKINAFSCLKYLVTNTQIAPTTKCPLEYIYDSKTHTIKSLSAERISIYSIDGKLINSVNGDKLQVNTLHGIYVINIYNSNESKTFKLIIK